MADDFWYHGLFVCPDVDILTYALSKELDDSKGWGLKNDQFLGHQRVSGFGKSPDWFNLGDRDLALSLRRTELLGKGWRLSAITDYLGEAVKTAFRVMPASNDFLQTFVRTIQGLMHLQEYWVKNRGDLLANDLEYMGLSSATANLDAVEACSDNVMICPANPVSSILPIVKLKGFANTLSKARVLAISPFVGDIPFSGPAAKLMKALGLEANSFSVAKLYSDWLDVFVVDSKEISTNVKKIEDLGVECRKMNIRMDPGSEDEIAKEIITAF